MPNEMHIVSVKDAFEIRANLRGTDHAPGLVIIFDGRQCGFELPPIGNRVEFVRPDGVGGSAIVAEMKEHGDGRSFFFDGLHRDHVPIGSVIYWHAVLNRTRDQTKEMTALETL